jgi:hypothetical protein
VRRIFDTLYHRHDDNEAEDENEDDESSCRNSQQGRLRSRFYLFTDIAVALHAAKDILCSTTASSSSWHVFIYHAHHRSDTVDHGAREAAAPTMSSNAPSTVIAANTAALWTRVMEATTTSQDNVLYSNVRKHIQTRHIYIYFKIDDVIDRYELYDVVTRVASIYNIHDEKTAASMMIVQ